MGDTGSIGVTHVAKAEDGIGEQACVGEGRESDATSQFEPDEESD